MGYPASVTNEVDPISRIEGHLGIAVNVASGSVTNAFAHGNLWRGFENFLLGREVNDAITFTQRICGVCPVPHGMTSTYAVDTVLGYSDGHITFAWDGNAAHPGVPIKAVAIRNLVLGAEFLMSSITHFYHLAAPSYIQGPNMPPWTPYFDSTYYFDATAAGAGVLPGGTDLISMLSVNNGLEVSGTSTRAGVAPGQNHTDLFSDSIWSAVIYSYVKALRIRRLTFEAAALFAGRMPMTSCFVGGGVTFDGSENLTDRANLYANVLTEVGHFIVEEYVPIALALSLLYPTYDNTSNAWALNAALSASVSGLGIGSGLERYVAWGAFPDPGNTTTAATLALAGGFQDNSSTSGSTHSFTVTSRAQVTSKFLASTGSNTESVADMLTEDIASSRYSVDTNHDATAYTGGTRTYSSSTAAYPGDVSRTKPTRGKSGAYTYMKAPRWGGNSAEVGPLARMMVSGLFVKGLALVNAAVTPGETPVSVIARAVYVKAAGGNTGLNPASINADIAVALLRAGLATVNNSTVGAALHSGGTFNGHTYAAIPGVTSTTAFDYNTIVANLAEISDILGTTGAHATLVAAYTHANTVITGGILAHILGITVGASTMDRLRARAIESLYLVTKILGGYTPAAGGWSTQANRGTFDGTGWVGTLLSHTGGGNDTEYSTWRNKSIPGGGVPIQGWGGTEAPRGALMHQTTIVDGKITKYQCIVPTTWNGSPCIGASTDKLNHGAIEAACIGAPFAGTTNHFAGQTGTQTATDGVEVLRVAESFDPCIACAVH
jgi:Ni,Fe-hydrogenase I large subunit